jgi:hypothetical protein
MFEFLNVYWMNSANADLSRRDRGNRRNLARAQRKLLVSYYPLLK